MSIVNVEISEKLLMQLRDKGRPLQELIIEALEQLINGETARKARSTTEPNREEVIQQLVAAGLVRAPGSWDTPGAKQWRERPEAEKQQLIKEMQATYFPDSFASNLVNENRR
jgi:hypothetical protein